MSEQQERMCVLLPCASNRRWALPQNCLAEILTLAAAGELPPQEANWRGCMIPVLVAGGEEAQARADNWRDQHSGTGLVAVIPGLQGVGCDYWAVAILGDGLRLFAIDEAAIEDAPEEVRDYASAAFRLDGIVYQVPDLKDLQAGIGKGVAAQASPA